MDFERAVPTGLPARVRVPVHGREGIGGGLAGREETAQLDADLQRSVANAVAGGGNAPQHSTPTKGAMPGQQPLTPRGVLLQELRALSHSLSQGSLPGAQELVATTQRSLALCSPLPELGPHAHAHAHARPDGDTLPPPPTDADGTEWTPPQRRAAGAMHVTPADDAQLCLGRIASLPNPFTGSPGMAPLAGAAKGPKARAARAPASLTPSPERSGSRAGARAAGQRSAREMKEMSVRLAMLASCVCVCVCLCVSVCVCVF